MYKIKVKLTFSCLIWNYISAMRTIGYDNDPKVPQHAIKYFLSLLIQRQLVAQYNNVSDFFLIAIDNESGQKKGWQQSQQL